MSKKVNPALPPIFLALRGLLEKALTEVALAEGYLESEGQNAGIGAICGLADSLKDIEALHMAALALHRSSPL